MNLWARKARLVLIIPALLLFSCEDEINTIGLDPENDLGIFFVEIPLNDRVTQVWVDDIGSSGTGSMLVGSRQYEGFGLTQSRNYYQLALNAFTPADDDIFDSVVLELRVRDITGADLGSTPQNIKVHQLTSAIQNIEETPTSSTSPELGTLIGESNFLIFPDSVTLNVVDTDLNPQDSLDALIIARDYDENGDYIYTNSVKLDNTFGQSIFDNRRTLTDSLFANDFFPLAGSLGIVPGDDNNTMITYEAASEFSRVILYFTTTDSNGDPVNNRLVYRVSSSLSFNNISPNIDNPWTGSDFDELTELYTPFETSNDKAYLQSGTNLFMKFDMSGITQFSDTVETYIIQSAELVISGLESVSDVNSPPSRLIYYLTNSDSLTAENFRVSAIPADLQQTPRIGIYNSDVNEYRVAIPQFLQAATDTLTFDQIIVTPVTLGTSTLSIENSRISTAVIPKDNMSLRFFYTIPENN